MYMRLEVLSEPHVSSQISFGLGARVRLTLSAREYDELFELYFTNQRDFIRTLLKVKPERVQSLVTGMCIQKTIMNKLGYDEITVSESGVREGFLMKKLEDLNNN